MSAMSNLVWGYHKDVKAKLFDLPSAGAPLPDGWSDTPAAFLTKAEKADPELPQAWRDAIAAATDEASRVGPETVAAEPDEDKPRRGRPPKAAA